MFCVRVSSHCTELLGVMNSELHMLYFEQVLLLGTREDVVRVMTGSCNGQRCSVSEEMGQIGSAYQEISKQSGRGILCFDHVFSLVAIVESCRLVSCVSGRL